MHSISWCILKLYSESSQCTITCLFDISKILNFWCGIMLHLNILIIISISLGFACPATRRHKKPSSTGTAVNCQQTPMAPGCPCHPNPMMHGCPCHQNALMPGCPCEQNPTLPICPRPPAVNCQQTPMAPGCPRPPAVNCQQIPMPPGCPPQHIVYFGEKIFIQLPILSIA